MYTHKFAPSNPVCRQYVQPRLTLHHTGILTHLLCKMCTVMLKAVQTSQPGGEDTPPATYNDKDENSLLYKKQFKLKLCFKRPLPYSLTKQASITKCKKQNTKRTVSNAERKRVNISTYYNGNPHTYSFYTCISRISSSQSTGDTNQESKWRPAGNL